jgi:site-specific DNA recombinase
MERQSEASIADQYRVCRQFAEQRGWTVVAEHSDEAISGAALGNRPGAQRALAEARSGDVLLIMDLTRLARSQDVAPMITRLRHRGVRVMGAQDGFDSDTRHARMQAGLSGIMSEEFRLMVSDRTRSALELRARTGQPTGGKAYEDPEIVREIFKRFADGESMKTIASDLNR